MKSIYDEFADDVNRYLEKKLPMVSDGTAMEVSEYISNRAARLVGSAIEARDAEWRAALRRG